MGGGRLVGPQGERGSHGWRDGIHWREGRKCAEEDKSVKGGEVVVRGMESRIPWFICTVDYTAQGLSNELAQSAKWHKVNAPKGLGAVPSSLFKFPLGGKRLSASAGFLCVWVLELESPAN